MRSHQTKLWLLVALVVMTAWAPSAARQATQAGTGPAMQSIGPLAFGPDGTLFAADNQGASVFALDLGAQANGGAAGAKGLDGLDDTLAALLGTGARDIQITDLAVHPRTQECLRVRDARHGRGRRADALPRRRRRQDPDGRADVAEVPEGRHRATRRPPTAGAPQPARAGRHRHGVLGRPAVGGGPLERGVRVEAARDSVSVRQRRRGHERGDLPRQPPGARDALAGERVRAVHDREQAATCSRATPARRW